MPYTVDFSRSADRDIDSLPRDIQRRVGPRIDQLADDPRPDGVVKMAGSSNRYRIRVGDYRVIYEIDDDTQTVMVTNIAHRRDVYRER